MKNIHSVARWALLFTVLLPVSCGPALIGAGLGSGGGGGGPGTPDAPTLVQTLAPFQPADDATLVGLTVAQSGGRPARMRFEYDLGQGRVRVPSTSIARYDIATRAPAAPLEIDAADNFVASTDGSGQIYYLLWQHAIDLGQVEQRGVTLFAVFVDADRDADFASEASNSVALLSGATVGRELGELANVTLERQSTEPESAFVVTAELRDRGGDREMTGFEFEYAVTSGSPTISDYVALPEPQPAAVTDVEEPDGRLRSDLTFVFDPLALNIPLGAYEKFWVRLRHRELYPQSRSDIPLSIKTGPDQVLDLTSTQIGFAPRIELASVVDPNSPQASLGDDGKPWLKLPIATRIFNPSPNLPARVRLEGTYTVGNATYAITPVENGAPGSATEFTLAPLERRRQYLIWNVVVDEGLGNTLVLDPPNSVVRVANIDLTATLLGAGTAPIAGNPLQSMRNAGFTTLSTNPFVGFRDNLAKDVRRIWSSGDESTQKTRDLFFTRPGVASVQEVQVLLDQQFEPLQIVPPPPAYDFSAPPFSYTNGVFDIVATDFDEGVPDCLAWINSQFFYMRWPDGNGAVPQQIGGVGATLAARGNDPVSFELTNANGVYKVAAFYTWQETTTGPNKTVEVLLTAVVRDPQGGFSVVNPPAAEVFEIEGTPPVNIQPVGGFFDADASSYELVLGTLGTEYATTPRPGLLHMWSFGLDSSGLTIGAPVELPKMPPPTTNPTQDISPWLMTSWLPVGETRPGLVVVRQLNGFPRRFDVWTLGQMAAGGFASSWQLLSEELAATSTGFDVGGNNLRRIFSKDLDGNSEGVVGSDLLLVMDERIDNPPAPVERYADVWLYAGRGNGPSEWRRIVEDLQVIDPDTLLPIVGEMDVSPWQLVDVNGDRLLDLVTCEAIGTINQGPRQYNYLASSLAGVAGKLGSVGSSAGASSFRSVLPGLLDANKDGYTDIISGSRLHLSNLDGSYTQDVGGFSGGPTSRHRVERMLLGGLPLTDGGLGQGPDVMEILVFDPNNPSQNRIDQISGIGGTAFGVVPMLSYDFGSSVQDLRALMASDSQARGVKDLVAATGSGGPGSLIRGRIDTQSMTVTSELLWNGPVDLDAGIALVRSGALPAGESPDENTLVQDVFAVDRQNPGRLVVCRADNNYQPTFVTLPAGQSAIRIAEGSVTADELEDVCVLTAETINQGQPNEDLVYRLICLEHVAGQGVSSSSPQRELSRFAKPFDASAIRSFRFDRGTRSLAKGFLLIDDVVVASTRSEVRLLVPTLDGTTLSSRVVLSPIDQPVDANLDAVVLDANRDGQVEVIGGDAASADGLKRLRTNLAPAGF